MGRAYQNRKVSMAKTSDAKARVYSKYAREIYVSAKSGGFDPEGNLALRSIIDRAKKDQVPSHVIDKAIDKAKGGEGEDFVEARYEGFGPAGCLVLVNCLTDNTNRTFSDIRQCFSKANCKIGSQGSVSHMFDHSAILSFKGSDEIDEDIVLEALIEADVDVSDIENEDGNLTIFAPHTEYFKAKKILINLYKKIKTSDIEFEISEVQFLPQNTATLSGKDIASFESLIDMLNDSDDVQSVFHSATFD